MFSTPTGLIFLFFICAFLPEQYALDFIDYPHLQSHEPSLRTKSSRGVETTQKNDPEILSEIEREYYRETWGFDPVTDRKAFRFGKNFLLSIVGQVE
jgi:hypothetical protein